MNIDIVNKQVSVNLNIAEKDVQLINKFYWRKIYEHLYAYNPNPVNIENICVLYPNKYLVKHFILKHINLIHKALKSTRFKEGSLKRLGYINNSKNIISKCLNIRKYNKFTN